MLNVSVVMLSDKTRLAAGAQLHLGCGKCSRCLSLPQQSCTKSCLQSCACFSTLSDRAPDVQRLIFSRDATKLKSLHSIDFLI